MATMQSAKENQGYAEECIAWAKTAKTEQEREALLKMAAECLDWAKTSKTEQERDALLKMAKDWLHAASVVGRPSQPHQPNSTSDDATA
jgi:hypothetical protein